MKSLYKNLVVSGCSFTHEPHNEWYPFAWPSIFAKDTNMTVTNLATPGAGNDHISRSIILYLEKNKPSRDDTLIIAMWSGIGRFDWITDASLSRFKDVYPYTYAYDTHNELVLAGNWWNLRKGPNLHSALLEYSKYQSDYSFSVTSWLAMENLSNYLRFHGYRHYFTSFVNYKRDHIKGDGLVIPFHETLAEIGLKIDKTNWMDLAGDDHYGDWALKNDAVNHDDGFHPRYPEANEGWVRQVLIPYFLQEGILQNDDTTPA